MTLRNTSPLRALGRWLLEQEPRHQEPGEPAGAFEGAYEDERAAPTYSWWRVMCLTGVDYFSSLGYQPGIAAIAAVAAGSLALAPLATLVLVLVTLFGALPMYRRVARESPHGQGSIAMFESVLSYWPGKLMALALVGFAATDFVLTLTISAAAATAHIAGNPLFPAALRHPVPLTLLLVALLGVVFLRGFRRLIGIAALLVGVYLALNLVVVGDGLYALSQNPNLLANWRLSLHAHDPSSLALIGASVLLFPRLALGLSGFETGVTVMPLVRGEEGDRRFRPRGRINNTRKLLTTAALIMSAYLIGSSLVTTLLIPASAFEPGGSASGRALAYLAHHRLGEAFGTVYDLSTILILWFAGASAMAGLLNIVPRYLPRYGMAPDWARATRPLVLIFTGIALAITLIFRADVNAQAAAYATGVLVLMTAAALAVTLTARRLGERPGTFAFGLIALVFAFTTVVNVIERPEGLQIALLFILAILALSLWSRLSRATELRAEEVEFDHAALRFLIEAGRAPVRFIAHHEPRAEAGQDGPRADRDEAKGEDEDVREYGRKARKMRAVTHLPAQDPVMFLEVNVADASNFSEVLDVRGVEVGGYRVLRAQSSAVPNAIAAILLAARDLSGTPPHVYFEWNEQSGVRNALQFLLSGEGDIAPLTHEVLRVAEPGLERRPQVHVA